MYCASWVRKVLKCSSLKPNNSKTTRKWLKHFVLCFIVLLIWAPELRNTFTTLQEPLGLFQPNLVQSILRYRIFHFVQIKEHDFFLIGDNFNMLKNINDF